MKHLYQFCIAVCALLALATHTAVAQEKCGTMERDAQLRRQYPQEMGTLEDMERWIAGVKAQMATQRDFDQVLTIPVVVHVIHNGEAVGTGDNISDAQVLSQIKVLNDDYRRNPGTRGSVKTHPDAIDTKIQFVMAKRDPNGRATTGIDRVNRVSRGWTLPNNGYSQNYTDGTIKPGTVWDANRYLNVWCLALDGLYGYAQFPPTSGLLGMTCNGNGTASTDGVAILTQAFGSLDDGNFNLDPAAAYGRTLTHELGHYFSLRHIWGDAACGTDYCEDTPIHNTANRGCPTHPKSNSCGTPDEMFENYMDYSDDNCVGIFTHDQAVRIRAVILNGPRRNSLLSSPALTAPVPNELSFVGIEVPESDICPGLARVRVRYNNTGVHPISQVEMKMYLDGVELATALNTRAPLAFNTQDTLAFPLSQFPAGQHLLQIVSTGINNVFGASDSLRSDTVEMPINVTTGRPLPYVENFQDATALPQGWYAKNPNNDCNQWRIQTMTGGSSGSTSAAAMMQLFQYAGQSQLDELYTPLIDLSTATSATLSFRYSHAGASSNNNTTLRVEVSDDCGGTFSGPAALTLTGTALSTANTTTSTFVPTAASQWRTATVDLSSYLGGRVRVRFVTVNGGGGNNIYIDNMGVETSVSQTPALLSFSPDTASVGDTVTLRGRNLGSLLEVGFYNNRLGLDFVVVNDSTIRAIVPAGATTGILKVTTLGGSASTTRSLVVALPPVLTAFTPSRGNAGTNVTITGQNFLGIRSVLFNGLPASFTATNATTLTATAPNGVTSGKITIVGRFGNDTSALSFIVGTATALTGTAVTTCSGQYADPGGLNGNYQNNVTLTQVVRPDAGMILSARFHDFDTESGYDFLSIYDGTSTSARLIGTYSGTVPPPDVTATNSEGALTFKFTSDNTQTGRGFVVEFSCAAQGPPQITAFNPVLGGVATQVLITGPRIGLSDSVWFNGTPVSGITVVGPDQIRVSVPAGATTGQIRVADNTLGGDTSLGVFTVLNIPAYCAPAHPVCTGTSPVYISKVQLDGTTLRNSSVCGSSSSTNGYSQYLPLDSTQATLKTGGTYLLRINTRNAARVGAWLDLNRDGNFAVDEFFTVPITANAASASLILVRVPASADTGLVVLRVRSAVNTQPYAAGDACTSRNSGEAEDYIVRLMHGCDSIPAPLVNTVDTICSGTSITLQSASSDSTRWYTNLNYPWISTSAAYTTDSLTASTTFYVVSSRDNCESTPVPVTVNLRIVGTDFLVFGDTVIAVTQPVLGYTYQWYMGNTPIPGADSAMIVITQSGNYSLQATFMGCTEHGAGRQLTYVALKGKVAVSRLHIWPNPTRGKLQIEAPAGGVFTLSDAFGRVVYTSKLDAGTQNVTLPALSSGVYHTRYISAKGVSVQPLTIE